MTFDNRLRESSPSKPDSHRLSDEAAQLLSGGLIGGLPSKTPATGEKNARTPADAPAAEDKVKQGQLGNHEPNGKGSERRTRPVTLEEAQRTLDLFTGHDRGAYHIGSSHSQVMDLGKSGAKSPRELSNEWVDPKDRFIREK